VSSNRASDGCTVEEKVKRTRGHALLLPLRLTEEKVAGLVRPAEDLVQSRVERV